MLVIDYLTFFSLSLNSLHSLPINLARSATGIFWKSPEACLLILNCIYAVTGRLTWRSSLIGGYFDEPFLSVSFRFSCARALFAYLGVGGHWGEIGADMHASTQYTHMDLTLLTDLADGPSKLKKWQKKETLLHSDVVIKYYIHILFSEQNK